QKQIQKSMQKLRLLEQLPSKEKAGLIKSLARFLQATFLYVQADRIIGFRRFFDKRRTFFDLPIELSRRLPPRQKLLYRAKVERGFRAFSRIDTKLPAEIVNSRESIYIFVFDAQCTKAATTGLEHEHQLFAKNRRVIWQY
ncbi:MAG: hypothetical protein AAGJ35_03260, partial [Myxococcota bacterium]